MTDARSVIDWLLDSDPSIRWQVMRDLLDAPEPEWRAGGGGGGKEGWGGGAPACGGGRGRGVHQRADGRRRRVLRGRRLADRRAAGRRAARRRRLELRAEQRLGA